MRTYASFTNERVVVGVWNCLLIIVASSGRVFVLCCYNAGRAASLLCAPEILMGKTILMSFKAREMVSNPQRGLERRVTTGLFGTPAMITKWHPSCSTYDLQAFRKVFQRFSRSLSHM